jgi:hypothetical protein
MYSSRLFNSTERNYTTTEREALAMVYALHKFKHYMLSSRFIFYINHMALVYLVNKAQISSRLIRWLYYLWNMISRLFTNLVDPI